MTAVFLSVIKTAKVVSVFKKDSKLDYSNYRPIEKIFENLCIIDYIPFSITIILSITYNLDLGNNILHLMP